MKTLSEIRKQIDTLDESLSKLLKKRLDLVISTLGKKDSIEDLTRESEIISKLIESCRDKDEEEYLKEIYNSIFREGKRIQIKRKNTNYEQK